MSNRAWMPLHIADYLSDTGHLTAAEHGAYLLLIMTYWQRGEALPDDDRKLARICRLGPREWGRVRCNLSEFFQISCGAWSHGRIEKELANVRDKSLKNRKAGLARAKQMHSERLANAKPSDTDTDTENTVPKGTDAIASPDKIFWDNAKAYIGGKNPGALIGKWSRDYGKGYAKKAIAVAQAEKAVDPVSFIERILRKSKREDEEPSFTGPC
jgi:uncharacterized protein YdaU (DUF1376 family)